MPTARARKCGWSRRTKMPADGARKLAPFATVIVEPFGDIWLRDTGPIVFGTGKDRARGRLRLQRLGREVRSARRRQRRRAARRLGCAAYAKADWVLEGGAIDHDGAGTVITTEQCLLNPNRNALTRDEVEQRLRGDLGFDRVVWLGEGLLNDHTDGHVDNLARFVAPGRVAIPTPAADDPNAAVYRDAARRLAEAGLDVVTLPSPGRIESEEGDIIPASYMNFYIGNAAVVVPQYGAANDEAAVAAIQALFPDRVAIGLRADHILTGGGSFHCISQQVPAMTKLTVAALQLAFGEDTAENIRNVSELVREAQAAARKVILPPELFEGPYFCRAQDEGHFARALPAAEHPVGAGDAEAGGRAGGLDPDQLLRGRRASTITTAWR